MENPEKELPEIIRALTESNDGEIQKATIDEYFTENAEFIHPLARLKRGPHSRDALKNIYTVYKILTSGISMKIHSIDFSPDSQRAMADTSYNSLSIAGCKFSGIRLITILDLERGKDGKFRISRQWDCFPIDNVSQWRVFGLPVNWIYDVYLRSAAFVGNIVGGIVIKLGLW